MLKGTRTMEAPVDLNIAPLNAPHRELEWLPLANRDYQMAEVIESSRKYHIPLINELKARHLSGTDILGILDSYLPIFYLPQVNVFPNLIDQCCTNYDPNQRAILSPSGSILFYITSEAINQMLISQSAKSLTLLSMQHLIDQTCKLSNAQITTITQFFIQSDSQPVRSPPFLHVHLNEVGKILMDMINYILG